jgi:hypothetical protein
MTKHIIATGDFQEGCRKVHAEGGQLMPQRSPMHPVVHMRGSRCTTLWPEKSPMRGRVMQLAFQVGYDPHIATSGRLCRHIVDDVLRIPYKETYFEERWQALARGGQHWHYLYAKPGLYNWGVEIDVKSAYWASFMSGKSCLLGNGGKWIEDDGILEQFGIIMDTCPKWLRVSMLGQLSSWRSSFFVADPSKADFYGLEQRYRYNIKHGALFNATHRAIARVYKFMQRLHEILGDKTLRIHTDGIIIDCSNGMGWENELLDEFDKWGFDYSIKGFGHCWITDVNSVVLGQQVRGCKRYIADDMRNAGAKIDKFRAPPSPHRWFDELPAGVVADIDMEPISVVTQTSPPLGI